MNDIELTFETDRRLIEQIEKEIFRFNFSRIGTYGYEPLSVTARDQNHNVIGSLIGTVGLNWLYIDILWVTEELRGTGLGTRLVKTAETEAKRRSCVGIYLYTYSFQNPQFYEKLGFVKFAALPDFPLGHEKYFMKKQFAEDTA